MLSEFINSIAFTQQMRVNTKVRYAIRMMADIAKHGDGQPVALKDVAKRQDFRSSTSRN